MSCSNIPIPPNYFLVSCDMAKRRQNIEISSDELIDRMVKRLKALEDYYDYCILERMMKNENIAASTVGNPAKHSPEVLEKIGMDILALESQLKNTGGYEANK